MCVIERLWTVKLIQFNPLFPQNNVGLLKVTELLHNMVTHVKTT